MRTKQIGQTREIICSNPNKPYHTYEYTIPPKTNAARLCRRITRTPKIHLSNIPRSRCTYTPFIKATARRVSRPILRTSKTYISNCTKCGWQNKITI
jgi:hypothetical protein